MVSRNERRRSGSVPGNPIGCFHGFSISVLTWRAHIDGLGPKKPAIHLDRGGLSIARKVSLLMKDSQKNNQVAVSSLI